MTTRIAISLHAALRTMFNSGFDSEKLLKLAHERLSTLILATEGYVYPDDVQKLILNLKQEFKL